VIGTFMAIAAIASVCYHIRLFIVMGVVAGAAIHIAH
jgi:hypothetical protein